MPPRARTTPSARPAASKTASAAKRPRRAATEPAVARPAEPRPLGERLRALEIDSETKTALEPLLGRAPLLASQATRRHDGRRIPLAFVRVRDQDGATRAGIEVRLLDGEGGQLLDLSRTDADGLVLLRFPTPATIDGAGGGDGHGDPGDGASGWLEVTGTSSGQALELPAGRRAAIVDLVLPALPPLPTVPTAPVLGDDVIPRLPSTFGSQVCAALGVVLPTKPHPVLGLVPNVDPADFRSKTTPIIRRLSERRVGPAGSGTSMSHGGAGPSFRRYVVRLRQEWQLLGYTLGELAEVAALDPGAVVEDVVRSAEGTSRQALDETQRLVATATAWLQRALDEVRSIDSVVKQTTTYATQVVSSGVPGIPATTVTVPGAGGFDWGGAAVGAVAGFLLGGPVGAVAGGAAGGVIAGAGKSTSVTLPGTPAVPSTSQVVPTAIETVDNVDTTLKVTDRLSTVQEQINTATRQVHGILQTIQRSAGRTVEQVSPLLQRVTNLLRWRVYENYLVCTHVEDVLEVKHLQLPGCGRDEDAFSAEDIVEYRPFFEPALLDATLRPYYDELSRAVRARDALLSGVYVEVSYRSPSVVSAVTTPWPFPSKLSMQLPPALLHVTVGDSSFTIPIPGGQGVTGGAFAIVPLRLDRPVELRLTLDATPAAAAVAGTPFESAAATLETAIDRVRIWFEKSTTLPPDRDDALGGGLTVTLAQPQASLVRTFKTPATEGEPPSNPLTRHVNRNCRYYLGLLLQAAIALPSLRDDAPQLAGSALFRSDSPIWHMPILGVEGDKLVFLAQADPTDPNVVKWLADPGTSTLFQLQAPGAYAEALQGLLELTDVLKYLHPALKQDPAPVVTPLPVTSIASPTPPPATPVP